ncbi:MAG TPA: L,D-transpeptidase [Devosiaceae bacterium]
MLRRLLLCALVALIATPAWAANVGVSIDLSEQRMRVSIDGAQRYAWPVSTARPGYRTPVGTFHPQRMYAEYYSLKYDMAPMPYAIFFYYGYAIHGTTEIASLGRPVSHGCVRLHPDNARILFDLVKRNGMASTTIRIRP